MYTIVFICYSSSLSPNRDAWLKRSYSSWPLICMIKANSFRGYIWFDILPPIYNYILCCPHYRFFSVSHFCHHLVVLIDSINTNSMQTKNYFQRQDTHAQENTCMCLLQPSLQTAPPCYIFDIQPPSNSASCNLDHMFLHSINRLVGIKITPPEQIEGDGHYECK